ncbi:phosphoesterase [Aggregatimonas sangjinii]|uniref:Phosphoesterase n=1 Tax=Aggregatimonas sangjinii TaxID=2583587 RepID=A0A5B7SKR7_9FLAO|nr:metallophosphoesterase [Aggregatimonas sangjinii]QCW98631.1 phosphoesterase [Aggregatimonas sangjinii]
MKGVVITKHFILIVLLALFTGCATYKSKYLDTANADDAPTTKEVSHTFYLVGDAGLSPFGGMNKALTIFKDRLDKADENSTAIFLGDNIYPAGMPDKKDSTAAYVNAKNDLDAQLKTLENYKGKPFFIPGNHDWYTEGLVGLEREQKYIQEKLDSKEVFFPEDGCPMKTIEVNDQIIIIALDTEWYLTNWNKRPDINDKCEIKDREKLFEEIESEIKKNAGKTIVMAFHHPMFSYGSHGGQYSVKQHLYPKSNIGPVPFLGTFVNVLRRTTGASIADIQNKRYTELKKRLVTLAQYSDKVIFVSGHEHTLQYIVENSTPQIVSGSGAKKGWTRLLNGSQFSTGHMGYATLEVYTDGSSRVRFYGVNDESDTEEFLFTTNVFAPDREINEEKYDEVFPATYSASIYTEDEIDKSGFFKGLWGERYRKYYATNVTAPTVNLDTLFGGLKPVRKGGGHQSKSLRLRHKDGKEYVMRALRKVSELYLQAMVFQEQYVIDDLEDSYLQEFLMDFYTGANPYAPFTIGKLSDAVGLYHTNPTLYYVPKQPALDQYNTDFGNELYMIEEHAGDDHDIESFGFSRELKSTDDMFDNLRDDEKYEVDSDAYLRARLFDMAIGDWDRHVDQWRWAEFEGKNKKGKKSKKTIYRPVPRDRDMAFSNMGDGLFMNIATRIIPSLRIMEGYKKKIRNVKGFNSSPKTYVLDVALLNQKTREEWLKQATYIQEHLTAEIIDDAFKQFPEEVRDGTVDNIKEILLSRIEQLQETANAYFEIINKYAVVTGTDKDDWFEINYKEGQVKIKGYRIIDGDKEKKFYENTFRKNVTKEVWVYGLDDDDKFKVKGTNNSGIKVRLIGGQNNDIYDVGAGKGTFIYDYKSKKNTLKDVSKAKVRLTDNYEVNTYRPLKFRSSTNQFIPTIGFNPDDGIKVGISNMYTFNGFRQNPFTQQHRTALSYYFATSGIEFDYRGEFANVTEKANLEIAARFTSPNFAINFFGFGNETDNLDDDLSLDYNRVRLQTLRFSPSLVWRGQLGSKLRLGINYENIQVEETEERFINTFYLANGEESTRSFTGIDGQYTYENSDNSAFPTIGMATSLQIGYKTGLSGGGSFGYVIPTLSFDYKLSANGKLVLATKWKAHLNIGNGFEFYQGASIGGIDGLRGFRNQRFTGKRSFYQNTDIRLSLGKVKTGILPTAIGLYGGFDYGRVWESEDPSNIWHTSYGGGFFLNMTDLISARAALFNSVDGLRFSFGIGFGF